MRLARPSSGARNYIYFGGGDITFGKLTMHDADLQLIDTDPRDPIDFYPARYNAQLVAATPRTRPLRPPWVTVSCPDADRRQLWQNLRAGQRGRCASGLAAHSKESP